MYKRRQKAKLIFKSLNYEDLQVVIKVSSLKYLSSLVAL